MPVDGSPGAHPVSMWPSGNCTTTETPEVPEQAAAWAGAGTANAPASSRTANRRCSMGSLRRPRRMEQAVRRSGSPSVPRRTTYGCGSAPDSDRLPLKAAPNLPERTSRPGPRVRRVLGGQPTLAELQRFEGVHHHRGLVEVLDADRRLDGRGLRAVRVAARVQRDGPQPDAAALAGLVVARDVEHHLVGVDVRVVVRHRDRLGVVVDLAR